MKALQNMLIAFTCFVIGFSQLAYSNVAPCNVSNYKVFSYNTDLMGQHIQQYGEGCNLINADLKGVNLTGANLENANFTGADLTNVNMNRAMLHKVNLTDANLTKVNLRGTNLTSANLQGATLTGTNLQEAYFRNATYSSTTQFDEGFSPKNYRLILVDDENLQHFLDASTGTLSP